MKYARFEYNGVLYEGCVERDVISPIEDSPFQRLVPLKKDIDLNKVNLLAPVSPSKIIAVGLNYTDHAEELKIALPKEPLIFLKAPSSVIGPGALILYPRQSERVDYEAELAIVMKRTGRNIPHANAIDYVFGYTCLNDVTARDLQKRDGQWTRAKSFDTFCPIGPYIVTDMDPPSLKIESFLNGELKQSCNTSKMIFSCDTLIEFISRVMTLEAGDIIATGTPSGIGPMLPGDEIEIRIEGIGSLTNKVAKDDAR
jgi:2-keto-4-pentenoate hydratase/2-oxohepta-3-ene-1,7-dioic acid hydratase in catechol pathway